MRFLLSLQHPSSAEQKKGDQMSKTTITNLFILQNLVFSCTAAIQAPLILMSQNLQETKDREQQNKMEK